MSEKVRLGFVGSGFMGQLAHIANYATIPDCELVALAEGRAQTSEAVARHYGIEELYPNHKQNRMDLLPPHLLNRSLCQQIAYKGLFLGMVDRSRDSYDWILLSSLSLPFLKRFQGNHLECLSYSG